MPKRATDAPLYRRGDSPYWWTWVYVDGKRQRASTKCTDRRAALAAASAMQREALAPRDPHALETVADALLAFLDVPVERAPGTVKAYHQRAANLADHIGAIQLAKLTRHHIESYVQARRAGPRTVRAELMVLRASLRLAKQRGRSVPDLDVLAVPVPGKIEPKERWLTRQEYAALMAELRPHWADWVRVAVYTGARLEEVNGLTWQDVDLAASVLRIRGSKSAGSDRRVPIAVPLMDWLVAQPVRSGPLVRKMIFQRRAFEVACRRAGIPRCTPHDLRRTFASWLLQEGVPERDIADLLGHTKTNLVRSVYAKTSLDRLRGAVSKL